MIHHYILYIPLFRARTSDLAKTVRSIIFYKLRVKFLGIKVVDSNLNIITIIKSFKIFD